MRFIFSKKSFYIVVALGISLLIYVLYRTEHTVVNQIFIYFFSKNYWHEIHKNFTNNFPLPSWVIYTIPEALWVFASTLIAKNLACKIKNININFYFFPFLIAISIEIIQLLHLSKGRFDIIDLSMSLLAWLSALLILPPKPQPLGFNRITAIFVFTHLIIFLSYVWY